MQEEFTHESSQDFIAKCQMHNLKVTPQRMAIYRELLKSKEHPTVDAMFQTVRKDFPNISYDTVSRTLQTFAEVGIADLVEVYGGPKRYDSNLTNHHHLHCVSCGKILDFQNVEYDNLNIPDGVQQHFTVHSSRVVLKGMCEKCSIPGNDSP